MIYWKLKACPKCSGDLFVLDEVERCLQCGYEHEALDIWRPGPITRRGPHRRKVEAR